MSLADLDNPSDSKIWRIVSMEIFKPTFLYIKRHTKTGLLYFGKTVNKDVTKYLGSGSYWKAHIRKHGKEFVETLWYCLYLDENSVKEAADSFSEMYLIVESKSWANLIKETGLDRGGIPKGKKQSLEQRKAQSIRQAGIKRPKTFGQKMGNKIWINDGQHHKRIANGSIIPPGWNLGRIKTWKSWPNAKSYSYTNTLTGENYKITRDEFCKMNNYPSSNPPCGHIESPIKYKHWLIASIN